jgi:hypothetical protein
LLLSFMAYPTRKRISQRRDCVDAFHAWLIRRAYAEESRRPENHSRLRRARLSPREVQSRVNKASRRIQDFAIPVSELAREIFARKAGGYAAIGKLLGAALNATSARVQIPKHFSTETSVIRSYVTATRSQSAQEDIKALIENFRSREWREYLPAAPTLLALNYSVLRWNAERSAYETFVPGLPQRCLAVSLLRNPHIWVEGVLKWSPIWRELLAPHFKENAFVEVIGKDDASSSGSGAFFDGSSQSVA